MTHLRAHILAAVLLLALCAAAVAVNDFPTIEWLPDGALITFPRPTNVQRVEVWSKADVDGKLSGLVLSENIPDRPIVRHRLFGPLGDIGAIVVYPRGKNEAWQLATPMPLDTGAVNVTLEIPYAGEADVTGRWGMEKNERTTLVSPGSEIIALVETYATRRPVRAGLDLSLPKGLRPTGDLSGWDVETSGKALRLSRAFPSGAPGEIARFVIPLKVVASEGAELTASLRAVPWIRMEEIRGDVDNGPGWEIVRTARLRVASLEKMAETVRAGEVMLPTDAEGALDVRRPRDTLVLPSGALLGLRRMLGLSGPYLDYYAPFAHQTVVFENRSAQPIPLAVSMRVTPLEDNALAAGFRAPDYLVGPDGTLTTTAELAPGAKTPVVLPIYARPDALLPGQYRTVVEARLLGMDTVVARVEHPFQAARADVRALAVTALAVVLSVGGLVFFLARQRRIFRSFRVSEIVLIALFATMTFVLVIFPGSLLGPALSAVAGPFAFLFQGLFFEVLRILVTVTLLVLVPRVGTITLVSIVRYLLGGLTFGGFTPVDLFYFGSSVVLMEGVLYLAGVTSPRGLLSRRVLGTGAFLYVALLMGLVNAATQYATYCLNITFYRLYFAEWFIYLAVGVNGFLYAALGTLPGLKLGLRLRRISE